MDHQLPVFRATMSLHAMQAVYAGRADLFEMMYHRFSAPGSG